VSSTIFFANEKIFFLTQTIFFKSKTIVAVAKKIIFKVGESFASPSWLFLELQPTRIGFRSGTLLNLIQLSCTTKP
jgi:hypothetical protein